MFDSKQKAACLSHSSMNDCHVAVTVSLVAHAAAATRRLEYSDVDGSILCESKLLTADSFLRFYSPITCSFARADGPFVA